MFRTSLFRVRIHVLPDVFLFYERKRLANSARERMQRTSMFAQHTTKIVNSVTMPSEREHLEAVSNGMGHRGNSGKDHVRDLLV